MNAKVKFRNYKYYPPGLMEAAHFRDDYDDEPDGAFFAIAEEQGLIDALAELGEWESENTYPDKKRSDRDDNPRRNGH